jgi:hypothetical protein
MRPDCRFATSRKFLLRRFLDRGHSHAASNSQRVNHASDKMFRNGPPRIRNRTRVGGHDGSARTGRHAGHFVGNRIKDGGKLRILNAAVAGGRVFSGNIIGWADPLLKPTGLPTKFTASVCLVSRPGAKGAAVRDWRQNWPSGDERPSSQIKAKSRAFASTFPAP